jgi:hypothetical protein
MTVAAIALIKHSANECFLQQVVDKDWQIKQLSRKKLKKCRALMNVS